jgi:hypothetical protein
VEFAVAYFLELVIGAFTLSIAAQHGPETISSLKQLPMEHCNTISIFIEYLVLVFFICIQLQGKLLIHKRFIIWWLNHDPFIINTLIFYNQTQTLRREIVTVWVSYIKYCSEHSSIKIFMTIWVAFQLQANWRNHLLKGH